MNQTRKEGNATVKLSDLIWRDHLSSYNSRAHSVRLNGMVTSIRLEDVYWTLLAEISEANALTMSQLISRLYEEMLEARRAVPNLASLLRVTCLRYLSLKLSQAAEAKELRLGPAPLQSDIQKHNVWSGQRRPERLAGDANPD